MRVVSLLPAATDIVVALGGADMLVGITHECDEPADGSQRPRVTAPALDVTATPATIDAAVRRHTEEGLPLFAIDVDRIAALAPDVILTQALCDVCAVRETDVQALAARLTPRPAVVTLNGGSIEGILTDLDRVGRSIGLGEEAEELVFGLRARLRRVHETLARARAPRPRIVVVEWIDPVFVAGHWVPDMVYRAGGEHLLVATGEHSRTVDAATVCHALPDGLVIAPCGVTLEQARRQAIAMLARDEWAWARESRIWLMDGNALTSRPGPHVVRGVELMARLFHPALFSPPVGGLATPIDHPRAEPRSPAARDSSAARPASISEHVP